MPTFLVNSLFKIPITIANVVSIRLVSLPPHPPPPKENLKRYEENEKAQDPMRFFGKNSNRFAMMKTFHTFCALIFATEIYLIISSTIPTFQLPSVLHNPIIQMIPFAPSLTWSFIIGSTLIQTGAQLRLWCFRTLGKQFTFELTVSKNHKLITSGPYSIVRHPAYFGSTMVFSGLIFTTIGPGSLASCSKLSGWQIGLFGGYSFPIGTMLFALWSVMLGMIPLKLIQRIPKEDMVMKMEFREQWQRWAKKTKYKLFPYIY
ncbi:Protein-S-isoprenylcysteine O-methyltransferase [Abortiporus biennis]